MCGAILVAAVAAFQAVAGIDCADPRLRAYVCPTKVVWQTPKKTGYGERFTVTDADTLLEKRRGQVPEGAWGKKSTGCRMVNSGEVPGILLDFGRELHGGVQLGVASGVSGMRVRLRFGESVAEAMSEIGEKCATNDHAIRDDVIAVPSMGTREVGNTGFRFLRIDLVTTGSITLEFVRAVELMRPMARIGSFRSSDERLNRIFDTAVRTVHLCCQDFLWDGIKRDRLVWLGDMHPEARAILAVFGPAEVLSDSIDYAIATTPADGWMNTMPNYTLWFLRVVREWYRHTGDAAWVRTRGEYLKATVVHVLANVRGEAAAYGDGPGAKVFLDWPTKHNKPAVHAGTRGLLALALDDAAELMDVAGDASLVARCRDEAAKVRAERPDPAGAKSAAALLALGGLSDAKEMFRDVIGKNGNEGVSTFYGYYMLEAMSAAGENQRALDTVRDYWGGMLDMGATSFWEDFSLSWTNNASRLDEMPIQGRKDIHGDFGEFCYPGFRHSLCHGWSAGPAAWCIEHVLGLEALDVGGKTVRVRPFLGDLDWAEGALPTAQGVVRVRHEKRPDGSIDTKIEAPQGVSIVR